MELFLEGISSMSAIHSRSRLPVVANVRISINLEVNGNQETLYFQEFLSLACSAVDFKLLCMQSMLLAVYMYLLYVYLLSVWAAATMQ